MSEILQDNIDAYFYFCLILRPSCLVSIFLKNISLNLHRRNYGMPNNSTPDYRDLDITIGVRNGDEYPVDSIPQAWKQAREPLPN